MGPLGVPELIFIFVLALLIFGPKKLPQLGKTFGKSMAEFRRASNDLRATFQREMDAIDRENQEVKDIARDVKKDFETSTYYDDADDDYYDDRPYDKTSSSGSSPSAGASSPSSETAKSGSASANGADKKASASAEYDGTPPDQDPSTVNKSTDASEVKKP